MIEGCCDCSFTEDSAQNAVRKAGTLCCPGDPVQADALLARLHEASQNPQVCYSHTWNRGDLVVRPSLARCQHCGFAGQHSS